jgi:hypothetical protein
MKKVGDQSRGVHPLSIRTPLHKRLHHFTIYRSHAAKMHAPTDLPLRYPATALFMSNY